MDITPMFYTCIIENSGKEVVQSVDFKSEASSVPGDPSTVPPT